MVEDLNPAVARDLKVEGSWLKFISFMGMFDREQSGADKNKIPTFPAPDGTGAADSRI